MDFDEIRDDETDGAPEERTGCLRGAWKLSLFLLVPAAITLALLPPLLSSDGGRRWALAKINVAAAPAHVSFERWSLGWLRPPVLESLTYDDPARGLSVKVGRVAFDRGLLRLLPVGVLNLGEIALEKPEVDIALAAQASAPAPKGATASGKRGRFFLPVVDAAVSLKLVDGRVTARGLPAGLFVAEQIEGGVTLVSWRKPIGVLTRMRIGGGLLAVEGRVQSIRDFIKGERFETPEKITLKLVGVDLAAFRPLLQCATGRPWIASGRAEGALTAVVQGKRQGTVEGGLMIEQFALEAPGQPPSPKGDVALMVDLGYDKEAVKITTFDFKSPWMRAEANGTLQTGGKSGVVTGAVKAKATLFLAALARDFASVLGLSKQFKMSGGEVRAEVTLEGTEKAMRVDAKAVTANLAMTVDGAPFTLNPEPSLEVKAAFPYGGWPEIEGLHLKAPFADVYASGRVDAASVKARLDLTRFSRDARRIMKTCPPMVGAAYLDVTSKRDGSAVAVTSFLKLSDVAAELRPGQRMVVSQGTLKVAGRVPLQGDAPQAEVRDGTFELSLEDGKAAGGWQWLVPAGEGRSLQVRGFSLASDMELGSVRRLLGGFIPAAVQRRMTAWQGRVIANVTAEASGDVVKARMNAAGVNVVAGAGDSVWRVPDVRMEGSVTRAGAASGTRVEVTAQGGGALERDGAVVFAEPAARVALDAALAADGGSVRVSKLELSSSLFDVTAEADATDLQVRQMVAAKGKIAVDFGAVARLLAAKGIDEFALTGREARAFTFAAPVAGGLATVLSEGEAAAAAYVGSCKGLGLSAGPAEAVFRLSKGVLKMAYEPALNGGRLRLVPEAAVGGRGSGVLGIPAKTRLLENVALTQEMMDTLLVNVNPLLQGSTVLGGTVTLDLQSCRVETGLPPEKGMAVDMDVVFKNLKLTLGPTLRELLGMINVTERVYEVAQLPVHVVVRDGRVQVDPVKMVIQQQPVIFKGWVAFNGAINYQIEVPVTERLAGAVAGRLLKGTSIKIPVTGTVSEPRLDTALVRNMLEGVIRSAVGERAVERVGSFLEKLQQELGK
jgi:hypothetical protein